MAETTAQTPGDEVTAEAQSVAPDGVAQDGPETILPDKEAIQQLRRSWLGSWITQSTALVLMIAGYLAAIGLVLKNFSDDFGKLHEAHPEIFWVLALGPYCVSNWN